MRRRMIRHPLTRCRTWPFWTRPHAVKVWECPGPAPHLIARSLGPPPNKHNRRKAIPQDLKLAFYFSYRFSTVKRKLENEDSPRTLTEPFMNITTVKGWRKECGELAELGGRNREIECEQRAYARLTGDLDAPLVRLHHRFDQAQSQSQSPLRAALIATVEAVPDLGRFFRRNPNAGIFNRDDGLLPLPESS